MGTRSLTFFYHYGEKEPFFCFYRQFDGYPTGHGQSLGALISGIRLVNGYQMDMKAGEVANGMGCLAAQVVASLKNEFGLGGIYIHAPKLDQDSGQEYEYHIHAWQDEETPQRWGHKNPFHTRVVVKDVYAKTDIFDGTFEQFGEWVLNPPQNDDGYIPVIHTPKAIIEKSLRESLHNGIVSVTFVKADHSHRNMRCTLNEDLIPEDRLPAGTSTPLRRDPHLFKVWDVEKQDWRSFREERIVNWQAE